MGRNGVAVIGCRKTIDCYDKAAQVCPYGYDPLGSGRHADRATGVTRKVGNTAQTTVIVQSRGELVVQCRKPIFCTQQDCADGFRCVKSERYPGRAVCALK